MVQFLFCILCTHRIQFESSFDIHHSTPTHSLARVCLSVCLVRPSAFVPCPLESPAAAPDDSTCDNGLTGVQDPNTDVCCPLVCGDACGGEGCGSIAGVDASQCCATNIIAAGASCADTNVAPCVVEAGEEIKSNTEAMKIST